MRARIALPLAVALTVGCGKDKKDGSDTDTDVTDRDVVETEVWEGIGYWLIQFVEDSEENETEYDCTENYTDAECDDGAEGSDTDWEYDYSSSSTGGADVVQILQGLDGRFFLYWDGDIYPSTGSVESSDDEDDTDANVRAKTASFEFMWEGGDESDNKETHLPSGKVYEYMTESSGSRKVTFDLDLESGTLEGTIEWLSEYSQTWRESDEWDTAEYGSYGQINGTTGGYSLVSDNSSDRYNYGNEDDCSGETCSITLSGSASSRVEVMGEFIALDDGEGIDADVNGIGWGSGNPND